MALKYLDTYALYEIAIGNPLFINYAKEPFIISDATLAEFYGLLTKKYNQKTADYWMQKLQAKSKPVTLQTFLQAIQFKMKYPKRTFSFFDAIGYACAQENNSTFVTGDKEFHDIAHVEFIKN